MPASSSRRILLSGVFVLGLLGAAGYFAFATDPIDVGDFEVFAPPETGTATVDVDAMQATASTNGKLRIAIEIRTLARVLPPRSPRPTCELVLAFEDSRAQGTAGTWVAGLAALPISPIAHGQQLVRFPLAGGRDHYRVTRLIASDRGRVRLVRGMTRTTRGRVVDAEARPLSGANVWIAGASAVTDTDGKFEIEAIPSDSGLPLVVRKPGYAALYRSLSGAQFLKLDERPLTLREGAELHVRFNGAEPGPSTQFQLLPAGGRDTRLLEYPFFMQAIEPGYEVREGMVVFANLPRGARVRVRVVHVGFAPVTSAPIHLSRPIVATTVRGSPRPSLRGIVTDPAGEPIQDAWVTSRPGDSGLALFDTGWLLAPFAYVGTGQVARTDAAGGFVLPRLIGARNETALTVQAEGCFGLEFKRAGAELRVTLHPARSTGQPALSLRAGPKLTGRVLLTIRDEDGDHGPYGWDCSQPFRLRISNRSLLQVIETLDGKTVTREVLVVDATQVTLGR